jgi:YD repeat-containing protein
VLTNLTTATPAGLQSQMGVERTVDLATPGQFTTLTFQTDTLTINGRIYTTVFDAAQRRFTRITPEGRAVVSVLDQQGRVTLQQVGNLEPVRFAYDERGRLLTTTRGSGNAARVSQMSYDANGYLASLTDPLGRAFGLPMIRRAASSTRHCPAGAHSTLPMTQTAMSHQSRRQSSRRTR